MAAISIDPGRSKEEKEVLPEVGEYFHSGASKIGSSGTLFPHFYFACENCLHTHTNTLFTSALIITLGYYY